MDKNNNLRSIEIGAVVTSYTFLKNSKVLVSTQDFQLFYLSLDSLQLEKLPSEFLSIVAETCFETKTHIFLCNNNSGFYVFDENDPSKVGFICDTTFIPNKEVPIFNGICYARKNIKRESIFSCTDGYNPILTKRKKDITFNTKFNSIANHTFIESISNDEFLTKDGNSSYFINGNQLCQNQKDFVGLKFITPTHGLFQDCVKNVKRENKSLLLDNSVTIDITCSCLYDNMLIVYSQTDTSLSVFPGITYKLNITFVPIGIEVRSSMGTFYWYFYDSINAYSFSIYSSQKFCQPTNYNIPFCLKLQPISFDPLKFYCMGDIFYYEPEKQIEKITDKQFFSHIYLLKETLNEPKNIGDGRLNETGRLIGISALNREIWCLNYNSIEDQLLKKFKGKLLQCILVSDTSIIVSTSTEMFEVKYLPHPDDYEAPLIDLTKGMVTYNDQYDIYYTPKGLYVISAETLDIHASFFQDTIKDVKMDRILSNIMVVVYTPKCYYALLYLEFDEVSNSLRIKNKIFNDELASKLMMIEPLNSDLFCVPSGVIKYREYNHLEKDFVIYPKKILYFEKLKISVFHERDCLFCYHPFEKETVISPYDIDGTEDIFRYDHETILVQLEKYFRLFSLKTGKCATDEQRISKVDFDSDVTWFDNSRLYKVLTATKLQERFDGIFFIVTYTFGCFEVGIKPKYI